MTLKREQVFIRDYRIVAAPFEIDGAPLMVDGYVADPALWQPLVEDLSQLKSMSRHFASTVRMWRCSKIQTSSTSERWPAHCKSRSSLNT